jgi:non-ribosomal peptide synthetase component F
VIGTDVANRNRVETENLIGFCINQLVLRTQLAGNPSFRELIARTWKVALGAYAHQDMPFDLLVKELNPRRAANRTPLFQAKLVLQNAPAPPLRLPGVTIESVQLATHTSKFDIMFSAQEDEHGLRLNTIYNADLFKPSTIERHVRHLDFTIKTMVAEPDLRLDRYLRRLNELETEYQQSRQAQFKNASRQRLQLNRQKDNRRASTP